MNFVTEHLLWHYRNSSELQTFHRSFQTMRHRGNPAKVSINVSLKRVLNGCQRQKNRFLHNSVVHDHSVVRQICDHITDSLPGHARDIRKTIAPYLMLSRDSSKNTRYETCQRRMTLKGGWTDWWKNRGYRDGVHMWQGAYAGNTTRKGLAISLTLYRWQIL